MGIAILLQFGPPLVAIFLCVRAVLSRDSQLMKLLAVAFAFLAQIMGLVSTAWVRATHPAAGNRGTPFAFAELYNVYTVLAGGFLLFWAFRTRDPTWLRAASIILGLIGLLQIVFSWRLFRTLSGNF